MGRKQVRKRRLNPHLHIQLSTVRPETHDLPGVVSKQELEHALIRYPDPRNILGDVFMKMTHANLCLVLAMGFTQCCSDFVGTLPSCTQDDAFISFRYAENWANGLGWVFNVDEYVEGFSNPLWTGLFGLVFWIGAILYSGLY